MTTYTGPVAVTTSYGDTVEAAAALHSWIDDDGRRNWGGTLTVDTPATLWYARNDNCRLRTMEGTTGEFMIRRTQPGMGAEVHEISGSGPVPF
jgi:hypothetical protein